MVPETVKAIMLRLLAVVALVPLFSACVSLTEKPRALLLQPEGAIHAESLPCTPQIVTTLAESTAQTAPTLDGRAIRVLTWNIHKEDDAGWERDLRAFTQKSDLLMLQEVVLQEPLLHAVEDAKLHWVMASSFLYRGSDIGVLTASRVAAHANCTDRVVEPLIRIPKSAVISWFRVSGTADPLAVVNVHAINFSLSLGTYRAQFAALADALSQHRGPIIFGGDLNTWTDARAEAVAEAAKRLGLTEITFKTDKRTLFLGKQLDHLFIRGLELVDAEAIPVTSSDHNPVAATLRIAAAPATVRP
jgi:endonuclease/exonuclease/phosphatase (EEP) superfamily protein YafD